MLISFIVLINRPFFHLNLPTTARRCFECNGAQNSWKHIFYWFSGVQPWKAVLQTTVSVCPRGSGERCIHEGIPHIYNSLLRFQVLWDVWEQSHCQSLIAKICASLRLQFTTACLDVKFWSGQLYGSFIFCRRRRGPPPPFPLGPPVRDEPGPPSRDVHYARGLFADKHTACDSPCYRVLSFRTVSPPKSTTCPSVQLRESTAFSHEPCGWITDVKFSDSVGISLYFPSLLTIARFCFTGLFFSAHLSEPLWRVSLKQFTLLGAHGVCGCTGT